MLPVIGVAKKDPNGEEKQTTAGRNWPFAFSNPPIPLGKFLVYSIGLRVFLEVSKAVAAGQHPQCLTYGFAASNTPINALGKPLRGLIVGIPFVKISITFELGH